MKAVVSLGLLVLCKALPALGGLLPAQHVFAPTTEAEVLRVRWRQPPDEALLAALNARYDVWSAAPGQIDLHIAKADRPGLDAILEPYRSSIEVLHQDVSALLANATSAPAGGDMHAAYHNLDGIEASLRLLAADHPALAQVFEVGRSYEGRAILGLRVGRIADDGWTKPRRRRPRRSLLIVGGQHAREWVAPAAALYTAHALLLQADRPPKKLRRLLDAFDVVIVPVLCAQICASSSAVGSAARRRNVDGYAYSWTEDRLWRKTRQPVGEGCQ